MEKELFSALFNKIEKLIGERLFRATLWTTYIAAAILAFWHIAVPYVIVPTKEAISGYHKITSYESMMVEVENGYKDLQKFTSSLAQRQKVCSPKDFECIKKIYEETQEATIRFNHLNKKHQKSIDYAKLRIKYYEYVMAILMILLVMTLLYLIFILIKYIRQKMVGKEHPDINV